MARSKRGSLRTSDSAIGWPVEKTKPTMPRAGRHRQADRALALGAGRDAELEPVRVALEEGDRRSLGLEQRDRGLDDRLEQVLLCARVKSAGNSRPPRCQAKCLKRGGQPGITHSGGVVRDACPLHDDPRRPRRHRRLTPGRACRPHPVAFDVLVVAAGGLAACGGLRHPRRRLRPACRCA